MKTLAFSKQIAKVLALLLAIAMLFTACGGAEEPADSVSDASTTETASNDANDATDVSSNAAEDTASKNQNNSAVTNQQQQQNQTQNTTKKKTVWDKNVYANIPKSVKSKDVHVLMWRQLKPTEKKIIDDFTKKTGIKVRITYTTEEELTTKMISLIAGKDSPDVVPVSTRRFPSVAVRALAPLDPTVFRLDDSCWSKDVMKNFAYNGKYYTVAMPKSMNCDDSIYVTYYLKDVLKSAGVSTTPWELYKQGKWNWEEQKNIAQKVGAKEGYIGYSMQSYDMFMYSIGESFVKYDGKKYTNNMDSKNVLKAWTAQTSLSETGVVGSWNQSKFQQGKVGLFTATTYSSWIDAATFNNVAGGVGNVEAVPVAGETQSKAYVPTTSKSWGTCKAAKNPEGAAYFLRYWLDVSNIDYDAQFQNKQLKEVFEILTSPKTKKIVTIDKGLIDYTASGNYDAILYRLNITKPAQITTYLNSQKGIVNQNIKKANDDLKRLK